MGRTGHLFVIVLPFFLAISLTVNACPPPDRAALLAFRAALKEPYLGIFNTWSGSDCCTNWFGVHCNSENRVSDIILRGESEDPIFEKAGRTGYMTGWISPSLCQLDCLTTLVVADWKAISSEIPSCITSLSHLRILELIGNKLSGRIPADFGKLNRLTVLNHADNQLSGSIPPSIVHRLLNDRDLLRLFLHHHEPQGSDHRRTGGEHNHPVFQQRFVEDVPMRIDGEGRLLNGLPRPRPRLEERNELPIAARK